MKILGISPLDKDATACLFIDGQVDYAIAEERLSRVKIHSVFPYQAIDEIFRLSSLMPSDIDVVAYAFADWKEEGEMMQNAIALHHELESKDEGITISHLLKNLPEQPNRTYDIPGLDESELYMVKNPLYKLYYKTLSTNFTIAKAFSKNLANKWLESAQAAHKTWARELNRGLDHYGLADKLQRVEHHLTHAANA